MAGDVAGYDSQIEAAQGRVSRARANAGTNHAALTATLIAWFPDWAVATARRIVEDQYEITIENPDRARAFRDAVLGTDWSGSTREVMASRSLDAHSDGDLETDRLVHTRLMFARASEGEAPDWLEWVVDRLLDAFVDIVTAHGYVPVLYDMTPPPARDLAKSLPRDVLVAAAAFGTATSELADAYTDMRAIRSARNRDLAATVWSSSQ
jgi:hypothetical protein